jgi:hypothetical protein
MRTFENSDLCEPTVRIVCLSSIASIAALWKTVSFDQSNSKRRLTLEPRFLDYTSILWDADIIVFKQLLCGLLAFLFARIEYDSVRTARLHSINPASSLQAIGLLAFGAIEGWMRICPAVEFCHNDTAFLRGAPRQTLSL